MRSPGCCSGVWRELAGAEGPLLQAWFQAVVQARQAGRWVHAATTPRQWAPLVARALERVRTGQRELLYELLSEQQALYGAADMRRVEKALRGWLRQFSTPRRPTRASGRASVFPTCRTPPTMTHAAALGSASAGGLSQIKAEALDVTRAERELPDFIAPPKNGPKDTFVGGDGPEPSWKAFFYRHGQRFDANHERAPRTSAVLELIELCRIRDEAPEILFSVLRPGSHIKPNAGASNVRLVMHLPLVVPPGCALRVLDHGDHALEEGRLMMFDNEPYCTRPEAGPTAPADPPDGLLESAPVAAKKQAGEGDRGEHQRPAPGHPQRRCGGGGRARHAGVISGFARGSIGANAGGESCLDQCQCPQGEQQPSSV